jgi:hypothetical protein
MEFDKVNQEGSIASIFYEASINLIQNQIRTNKKLPENYSLSSLIKKNP